MRLAAALLSLLVISALIAACGETITTATPDAGQHANSPRPKKPKKEVVRRDDPAGLGMKLSAVQPGWPGPRLPVAPPRRGLNCKAAKCVALTFDDGPGDYTGTVLDLLAAHDAKATFFLVGEMITKESAGHVRRMVSEGHELGNHSWDHADLTHLSPEALRRQLVRTQEIVEQVSGVRMRMMRPPYGATNERVAEECRRVGLAQILWSIDTLDWRDRQPDLVAERSSRAEPGGIVLMHDIHKSTMQALPRLLDRLDRKGYTYVTVSELFGHLTPGREYFDRGPTPHR